MIAQLVALIVLMGGAGTAAGAELGRMFFTPAQRATLDNFRKLNVQNAAVSDDGIDKDLAPPAPAPGRELVSVDGLVRRSDGKNTVWLNNRAISGRQAGGIGVATGSNDNRVRLTIPQSGRRIDLKVGQTAEIVSGTVAESYAWRAPPPKPEVKAAPPVASRPAASEK